MTVFEKIHQDAVRAARAFRVCESNLIWAIQAVDSKKVFRKYGYGSLREYCVKALKLTDGNAYGFIRVARKSVELPQMGEAISQGTLCLSQAKRIVSVINKDNQSEWIEKASQLSQRALEKEIAKENPEQSVREHLKPISENLSEFKCGSDSETDELVLRVLDVASTKNKKPCSFREALKLMAKCYLEVNDPIQKAERAEKRKKLNSSSKYMATPTYQEGKRTKTSQDLRHQLTLRDRDQCTHIDPHGNRCQSTRWTQMHHIVPVSEGGQHILSNLTTLCSSHHQLLHDNPHGTKRPRPMGPVTRKPYWPPPKTTQ